VDDPGIHAACCGPNTWTATQGSLTVFINGKGAHRMGDQNRHCGGMGQLVEGSPNVIVGETGGGGGASGGGGRAGGDGSATSSGGSRATGGSGTGSGAGSSGGAGSGPGVGGDPRAGGAPHNAGSTEPPVEPDQIVVRVLDAGGKPLPRAIAYQLTLPDGSTRTGQSDGSGVITITALTQRGDCTITFPTVDNSQRSRTA
jgi:hypothetical protein